MTQSPKIYEQSGVRSGNPDPRHSRLMRRRPLPLRPVRIQPRQLTQPFSAGVFMPRQFMRQFRPVPSGLFRIDSTDPLSPFE